MHPILLRLGPLTIHTYGLMLALGVVLGLLVLRWNARRLGLDPDAVQSEALWLVLAGLAGARLAFFLLEPGPLWPGLKQFFFIWQGGLVFYGGVIAAGTVAWWRAHRRGWALPTLADLLAPSLALGQALGRVGCFFSGDSYGKPWDGPWAVVFRDPHSLAPKGVPLHPTQLYIASSLLVIFGVLTWLVPRRRFAGQIVLLYGLLHGVARVLIEPLRGDWRGETIVAGLTPTGLFALGLATLCLLGLLWSEFHFRTSPGQPR
ncbi:MAG: prolipoprotein diacylglyceryl transferase [Desulfarculaceae bacterium]|nr:prolipoprotein diacylglyceryl transferase [Desulfarculaceae bacterium]MCF8047404.1 prolipoprotein diacylglyceryl transferase [Desulfarculaceae bacterium]MCF8066799.1 prolipoprotein diacylglyceryl transferase [Desulfarculaceae bacterium]MCF8096666.1 prolipoprotein diacylglyceryl transferase [Desulfarculaceae bacterium]